MQVVEKSSEKRVSCSSTREISSLTLETAVEGDAAERQRQRNGFRAAQGFDFAATAEANQQGVKGRKAPLRLERLERAPLRSTRRTRPDSSVKTTQHQASFNSTDASAGQPHTCFPSTLHSLGGASTCNRDWSTLPRHRPSPSSLSATARVHQR